MKQACVDDLCLDGNLDAMNPDADGDGLGDLDEPAMICVDARVRNPVDDLTEGSP
jgi:hypothetical protein